MGGGRSRKRNQDASVGGIVAQEAGFGKAFVEAAKELMIGGPELHAEAADDRQGEGVVSMSLVQDSAG
jgi:hypothetical protein